MKAIIKNTKNNVNNSKVIYTKKDGKNVAIYKDKNGIEHIVLNKCPHMKCGITLNEVEQTCICISVYFIFCPHRKNDYWG